MTIAHVVTVETEELASVVEELARVAEAVGAAHVHYGPNAAPPEFAGTASHAFVALFKDRGSLLAYLDDPTHLAAASQLGDEAVVTVIDLERTFQ